MEAGTKRIVRIAIVAAYVVGIAGVASAVLSALFVAAGEPWGTLIDVALLAMTAAIAPLMLAFYELGGLTPTPLARVAQAGGWIAVVTWSVLQVLMIARVVGFDFDAPARDAFGIWSVALLVIGSWVAGANLLAGPWLGRLRWLGVVTGLGVMALGIGLLLGGANQPLTYLGGLLYQFGTPVWAFLMARRLRWLARTRDNAGEPRIDEPMTEGHA